MRTVPVMASSGLQASRISSARDFVNPEFCYGGVLSVQLTEVRSRQTRSFNAKPCLRVIPLMPFSMAIRGSFYVGLKMFSIRVMTRVTVLCLAIFFFLFPAMAESNSSNYIFLLASGFLCDPGDSSTCPAAAKSNQGDSYEINGAGTFDVQSKSVKAAGTYTHKSANGNVLETGVWVAIQLVSFDSYGPAPNALPRQGTASRPAPFGPNRLPMFAGPIPTGGLAVLRIRLFPVSGLARTAVLQVNCALGDVPPERSVQGIRLSFEGNRDDFSEELGGRVMFLAVRPEASSRTTPPQQKAAPENPEPPPN